jgi:aminoglycoside phosphotransferase (APT) family kinase protein
MDEVRLAAWMDGEGLGSGPIEGATRLSGGTQNILVRFSRAGRGYVLRRPPATTVANGDETMRREARVLAAIAHTDVPHARLIASCGDPAAIGAAFYLMEPVEGFNATVVMPELHSGDQDIRRRMGLYLVDAIGKLGRLDAVELGLGDFGKTEDFLVRQPERWKRQLDDYGRFNGWGGGDQLPGVDAVGDWLNQNCPSSFMPGIMHGDYHLANVMYRNDGPEIAAIVDWELATLGDPLIDLGWLLATWPDPALDPARLPVRPWDGFPTADLLVERYAQSTPRDLSQLLWYKVLACYKLAILLEGTHARAAAGKADVATGRMLHDQAVFLFRRAHQWLETDS